MSPGEETPAVVSAFDPRLTREYHGYHQLTSDILRAVNGAASRTAGGIFAGLRHDLFSRVKRPALAVEQVYRWLCHTAVTPILTVRTRSYLLAHILRPVTIRVPDQSTR